MKTTQYYTIFEQNGLTIIDCFNYIGLILGLHNDEHNLKHNNLLVFENIKLNLKTERVRALALLIRNSFALID